MSISKIGLKPLPKPIPSGLMTAYTDVINHREESDFLPTDPNDYLVWAHFHSLDRACRNDIEFLSCMLPAVEEEEEDPSAAQFMRQCLRDAKRLRRWNVEAFNADREVNNA
ncbi:hypothetical protein SynBIOSE41_01080 [Synechococcus sp. BIOS-E4-1]|uniref:hypothetical protein n=1 Tax=Synechococcus sp. BIOS-E4-1 TaxID=1400864 RepID=UPI0016444AAA|nr:hypothetical protein [Synechococcus sp. BIOS-E4-1]QNI53601.1 hypothetical protein SynBIOSE41_01080 [Synechococcus sp. BIOS-E4-1]